MITTPYPRYPYRWQIVTADGRVLATSYPLTSKRDCLDDIRLMMRSAGDGQLEDLT